MRARRSHRFGGGMHSVCGSTSKGTGMRAIGPAARGRAEIEGTAAAGRPPGTAGLMARIASAVECTPFADRASAGGRCGRDARIAVDPKENGRSLTLER